MNGPVPGLSFDERALYVDGDDVLVLADLHVGRAESSAVTLPMGEAADVRGTRSPLVTDIDRLRPIVYDPDADETFRFPALGELRGRL